MFKSSALNDELGTDQIAPHNLHLYIGVNFIIPSFRVEVIFSPFVRIPIFIMIGTYCQEFTVLNNFAIII